MLLCNLWIEYLRMLRDSVKLTYTSAFPDLATRIEPSCDEMSRIADSYSSIFTNQMDRVVRSGMGTTLCRSLKNKMESVKVWLRSISWFIIHFFKFKTILRCRFKFSKSKYIFQICD